MRNLLFLCVSGRRCWVMCVVFVCQWLQVSDDVCCLCVSVVAGVGWCVLSLCVSGHRCRVMRVVFELVAAAVVFVCQWLQVLGNVCYLQWLPVLGDVCCLCASSCRCWVSSVVCQWLQVLGDVCCLYVSVVIGVGWRMVSLCTCDCMCWMTRVFSVYQRLQVLGHTYCLCTGSCRSWAKCWCPWLQMVRVVLVY